MKGLPPNSASWWPLGGLALALSAQAQPHCIDARPTGRHIQSLELAFSAADGRSVRRRNLVLEALHPERGTITVMDAERPVELDLRTWTELRLIVDDQFSPMAQRSIPMKRTLPPMDHVSVPITQLALAGGVIRFPGCVAPPDGTAAEVRFKGTLRFDVAKGLVDIDGSITHYELPPAPPGNPGARK